jgi:hypothetical protein
LDKSYNGICILADLFVIAKIPNKLSGVVAGGTVAIFSSDLVRPRIYFIFFDSISTPTIHGAAIHSTALRT